MSATDPAGAPGEFRVEPRPEGGVRLVCRITTGRDVRIASLFFVGGAACVLPAFRKAGVPGEIGAGESLLLACGGLAAFVGAALLVWALRSVLFPEYWIVGRNRLDVFRGFLRPKLVASFGAGPIEAVRVVFENRGTKTQAIRVQIPVPFVAEPFELYGGGDADAMWLARFLERETGWTLLATPDAGHPDRTNV